MKKSTYNLIVLCLSLVILIGGAMLLYRNLSGKIHLDLPQNTETVEETVPDFTMMDASEGTWKLSEFRGKPVILNFWASTCPPCMAEMPLFQSYWEEYGEQVHFVIVNLTDGYNDTFASAMKVIEENNYTFPIYFDTASEGAIAYGIRSMPTTFFIDDGGVLVTYQIGMLTEETLTAGIKAITGN